MPPGRWDAELLSVDLGLYGWLLGRTEPIGIFPLVRNPLMLRLLDGAYALLLPEVVLVTFVVSQTRREPEVTDFLRRFVGLYLAGIAIFVVFPVNGPHLAFPDTLDIQHALPTTLAFVDGMFHDYQAVATGGQLSGYGYFIAVPSLHVLVAIFLQHSLRPFPVLFKLSSVDTQNRPLIDTSKPAIS